MSSQLITALTPLAGLALAGVVFAVVVVATRHGSASRAIVVVNRRTYRQARARIEELLEAGEWTRAHAGMLAARLWLRQELHTGPRRHRIRWAAELEQMELREHGVREQLGLEAR